MNGLIKAFRKALRKKPQRVAFHIEIVADGDNAGCILSAGDRDPAALCPVLRVTGAPLMVDDTPVRDFTMARRINWLEVPEHFKRRIGNSNGNDISVTWAQIIGYLCK